jgi:hypothetical protein
VWTINGLFLVQSGVDDVTDDVLASEFFCGRGRGLLRVMLISRISVLFERFLTFIWAC